MLWRAKHEGADTRLLEVAAFASDKNRVAFDANIVSLVFSGVQRVRSKEGVADLRSPRSSRREARALKFEVRHVSKRFETLPAGPRASFKFCRYMEY